MLTNMLGGPNHFEIGLVFRNSYRLSSILSNSEVWHGVTKTEIELLEQVDETLLRDFCECSRNVPKDLLYLEFSEDEKTNVSPPHSQSKRTIFDVQTFLGPKKKSDKRRLGNHSFGGD